MSSKIYFFIDKVSLEKENTNINNLPLNIEQFYRWDSNYKRNAFLCCGSFCWTLQTYLFLKKHGVNVNLVDYVPENGILIGHKTTFKDKQLKNDNNPSLLKICIQGDKIYSPFEEDSTPKNVDISIVQNMEDSSIENGNGLYVPFWPHYNIVPRESGRKSIKTALYCGWKEWLDEGLQSETFLRQLSELGVSLETRFEDSSLLWTDYSEADLILAIRSFDNNPYVHKPPIKLINAWTAGVPAIVGMNETAYHQVGIQGKDFIGVSNIDEVITMISYLKENPQKYTQMRERGFVSVKQFSEEKVVKCWLVLLDKFKQKFKGGV